MALHQKHPFSMFGVKQLRSNMINKTLIVRSQIRYSRGVSSTVPTLREVHVSFEALEEAFENNAPEIRSFLDLNTGDVYRVIDGVSDRGLEKKLEQDPEVYKIEPVSSREQYRWMERFIESLNESEHKEMLQASIDGRGAFRRFKDALQSMPENKEHWYTFRSKMLFSAISAWFASRQLRPIKKVEPVVLPIVSTDELPVQHSKRFVDGKKRLLDLIDKLHSKDIPYAMVYFEFLLERRAKKNFEHRTRLPEQITESGEQTFVEHAFDENDGALLVLGASVAPRKPD